MSETDRHASDTAQQAHVHKHEHRHGHKHSYDYLIVGSGFGGSVCAHRLTEKGYRVAVMEQGKRWTPDNMPRSNWRLSRWLWRPMLGLRGFFTMSFFRHVIVLHGNAVGGGSITYAQTLLVPPDRVWDNGQWAGLNDWHAVMPAHYATAKQMLGVTTNRIIAPADHHLKRMAAVAGCEDTWYPTEVGIFFGPEGESATSAAGSAHADPYFAGEGPERHSCIGCGGCMMGCRHGAKNSLDKNYLYLAEKHGAQVHAETKVIDVVPLNGKADGADGYAVTTVPSTFAGLYLGLGKRIPTFIPEANDFVTRGAEAIGAIPGSSIPEILFNIPTTAHCMGGAAMAASPEEGVCDGQNRVFHYRNMLICDSSMLAANLGVNPSLTITALAEHAMSHIPRKD